MNVILQPIRYYTATTPYHYTSDNLPLSDLEQNDIALKNAVETLSQTISTQIAVGNWTTLKAVFDLQQDMNKPFGYLVKIWAIKDQANQISQSSSMIQCSVVGYNTNPGAVTVFGSNTAYNHSFGAGTLTPIFTGNGNNLELTFSGYTGLNGYVVAKIERFGL